MRTIAHAGEQVKKENQTTGADLRLALMLIPLTIFCASKKGGEMVREPVFAGGFYPSRPDSLKHMVDKFFAAARKEPIDGEIIGISVPHAGYPFSGAVAAYGINQIAGADIKTVVMIGPSHQVNFPGCAVYARGAWKTPLGKVEIDSALAAEIIKQNPQIQDQPNAFNQEHSLEVELPLLQTALKNFKIVPIMMADQSRQNCTVLAQALARVLPGKKVLILASSDLYHGYSYENCVATDAATLSFLEKFDPDGLLAALAAEKVMACGGGPIATMMMAAKLLGATKSRLLKKTNSNDVVGEQGGYVVGYGTAIFYKEPAK